MILQYGLMGKDAGSQILWPELDPKTHMIERENSHKLFGLHMHEMLYYPHPTPQNLKQQHFLIGKFHSI